MRQPDRHREYNSLEQHLTCPAIGIDPRSVEVRRFWLRLSGNNQKQGQQDKFQVSREAQILQVPRVEMGLLELKFAVGPLRIFLLAAVGLLAVVIHSGVRDRKSVV